MNTVKWGIIGCGDVTEKKSGPAFNKVAGSELVAVMRRDAEKAEDYAKRHNVPKWYSNADELINDPDINAIYVATPPDTHASYTIKALKAGKPVYVEKPMARNSDECREMVEASEKYNTPLFVAYYRRSLPGFRKVRDLIAEGAIGKPLMANIQLNKCPSEAEINNQLPWRVDPEVAGGGHFYDLASHQLDYLDYLFGPIAHVQGVASNQAKLYKAEDTVSASFVFENGVVGSGSWCFSGSEESNTDKLEIIGDKGQITFSCFGFDPVILKNQLGEKSYNYNNPDHVQFNLIEEIVNDLLGKGTSPSNGLSGMRTNKVLEQIVTNYYK